MVVCLRVLRSTWLLLAVALLATGWSLAMPFLAEDFVLVERVHGCAHRGAAGLFECMLSSPFGSTLAFFRPVHSASMVLDYALWGTDPRGYHATNILLWMATVLLLRSLVRHLVGDATAAGLAALVFAVSPFVGEVVGWVTGRDTLLPVFFTLATLRLLACEERWLRCALALVAASLAYFAKEWAAVLVPCVAVELHAVGLREGPLIRRYLRAATALWPILGLAVAYFVVRALVIGEAIGGYGGTGLRWQGMVGQRFQQFASLLFPLPMALTGEAVAWLGSLVVLAGLWIGLRTADPALRRFVGPAVVWIIVVNLAHVSVRHDRVHLQAARYVFPALPALCLLLAVAATGRHAGTKRLAIVLFAVVCALGAASKVQDWRAAGAASRALHAGFEGILRSSPGQVAVLDVPGMMSGCHFGTVGGAMTRTPFLEPGLAGRARVVEDVGFAHAGARVAAFAELCRAAAQPQPGTDYFHWDRARGILRPALPDGGDVVVRGRTERDGAGSVRMACSSLQMEGAVVPEPGAGVGLWQGFVAERGAHRVLRAASVTAVHPSLELCDEGTARVRVRIRGEPGAAFALLLGRARAPQVLGAFGLLLVDAAAPAAYGYLDARGAAESVFAPPDRDALRVQVALFSADSEAFLSECTCLAWSADAAPGSAPR